MDVFRHCLEMLMICRARALQDVMRREQWLELAGEWNSLAGETLHAPSIVPDSAARLKTKRPSRSPPS
jgi:hypothetical protein